MRTFAAWFGFVALLGCGGKDRPPPAQPTPVAASEAAPAPETDPAPAPAPEPAEPADRLAGSMISPECDEYLTVFDRILVACESKLGGAMETLRESRESQRAAFAQWAELDEEARRVAAEAAAPGCKQATDALRQASVDMGCPVR